MKLVRVGLLSAAFATFVNGFSFTELTPDEESRIYGGSNAEIGKHLYIASLHSNGSDSELFCGGTLITPQYILTAGHCLNWPMYDVYVSLGSKHRSGGGSQKAEMIRAVEAYRHPLYQLSADWTTLTHDVALLKLETPSKIQPARLASADGSDNKPGMMATTLGWGLVNNETGSETLQTVDVEINTNKKCAKMYADARENSAVDDSVICAGHGNGKDSCSGDSGRPLLVSNVVVGVVSGGPDECGVLPGIYARVSNALGFISDIQNGGSTGDVTELLTAGRTDVIDAVYAEMQDGAIQQSE
ncbi:hypothetical protein F442_01932 [Phytophthora nicotianae P10297]|uniref:Peptidase S1 domain-containing protein n=1 Tax=Phytophthora nicotianae P10297 TaxID=1317064 RepID=W3A0S1_PHYNI|nr:hypothetical protein F442_01932 [Phytophthora nicotianae P10297]